MTVKKSQIVRSLESVLKTLKKGWTQNMNAANKNGLAVGAQSSAARAWCLNGAILKLEGTSRRKIQQVIVKALPLERQNDHHPRLSIVNFNDHYLTKKSDVLQVVQKAIKIARGEK